MQEQTLSNIYEWLADKGVIQKMPSPVQLTVKSQVTMDEATYYSFSDNVFQHLTEKFLKLYG